MVFWAEVAANDGPRLWDVLYGGSALNLCIWIGLLLTSFLVICFAVDAGLYLRREHFLPGRFLDGVGHSLSRGDLTEAVYLCRAEGAPIARILDNAFCNARDGYESVERLAENLLAQEGERVMQRVNRLNVCGQLGPMLGLMGTVVGMVMAFSTLANAAADEKSRLLAQSISTALWTTCAGLVIAVPALLLYSYMKNCASERLLEMEQRVDQFIKIFRGSRVVSE